MKKQVRTDIVARADDAFGSAGYAEYSVEKVKEGAYKTKRFLMVLAYIGVGALVIGLAVLINALTKGATGMFFIFLIALAPLAVWVLVHFTWKFVSIEYKYVIDHSEFTLYTVYGGKDKKTFSCRMKDFTLIAPYNDEYKPQIDAFEADRTVDGTPSMSSGDIYGALSVSESGERTKVFVQVTAHTLKAFKYYSRDVLVMSDTLR